MIEQQADKRLTRLISVAAFAVAATVGISLPALHFLTNYKHQSGEVKSLSELHGALVTNTINRNPVLWRFEEHRLMTLVETGARSDRYLTRYTILDANRTPITRSTDEVLPWPRLRHEVVLYDSTNPVGYYLVERSMRPLLHENALFLAAGLLLALLIAVPLRSMPLRALRESHQRLVHMAHHDALTGLPNRTVLEDRIAQAILYAERHERFLTVVFLDLDHFKTINDSLGHDVGDELLRQTARRMQQAVRRTDTVVRLGGDEFVLILFDQPKKKKTVNGALQRIREAIAEPLSLQDQTLRVTCSMGVAIYPQDGQDALTLLKNADAAMYRAKELGRNNFQHYTEELNSRLKERIHLHQGLLGAIENNEFQLVYQPQIEAKTGRIVGVEALIRWHHPEVGTISPAKFIPHAEETGLIVPIGEWALRTACKQNKAWQDAGLSPIKVSVNVSARQFQEASWSQTVAQALEESGLAPQYLELEITESMLMENVDRSIGLMQDLQQMGVQLSIDDFGTGYSSLSALKHFPVARLKIDQSFIHNLPDSENDRSIATAVIALAHRLNLKVVAEGVETERQEAFLQDNECDEMQGYHFSKPLSARAVERMFLKSQAAAPEILLV